MDRQEILEVIDRCLGEHVGEMPERPGPDEVRKLSLACQSVLFEVYGESRAAGALGDAEDLLRNDNIKAVINSLPEQSRPIARDVLICAHSQLRNRAIGR